MRGVRFAGLFGMAMVVGALAGCVDEEIVYRDKPLFEDPPQAAVGFLGYSNTDQKKTTCGNCHAGQQVAWKETAHADAWASLQANSHKNDTCNDCHTVSNLGNKADGTVKVAYSATKDSRYWDVQCESCHGGGLEHVQNPSTDASKPMASMAVGKDLTNGCGECHQGSHNPFTEEWASSTHGRPNPSVLNNVANNPASYTYCLDCHEGKAALKNKFGVKDSKFLEVADSKAHGTTCIVCHDPHGNGQPAQLRKSVTATTAATNLCYGCHIRNPVPSGAIVRNYSHAPHGPLVFGDELGWRPPGMPTDKIVGTHATAPETCATCHMASYAVTPTTNTTGHSFQAIPCKDANGAPTTSHDCTMTQRSFKSCVGSGCHGTETAARSATIAAEARLTNLSAELKRLVTAARATTKGAADWKADTNVTPLEGVDFNSQIMEHDLSRGAHNPFYLDALLTYSISDIKTRYGVQ